MKKTINVILAIILITFVFSRYVNYKKEKTFQEEVNLCSFYYEGYLAGYDDCNYGRRYYSSVIDNYDKLKYQYKIAYDAGYGFGYSDATLDTNANEDKCYEYFN